MSTLEDWTAAVVAELGVADAVTGGTRDLVLDLARDVAHGVARPAAPLTAYLVGLAAGAAADPGAAAEELAGRISRLAREWSQRAGSPDPGEPADPPGSPAAGSAGAARSAGAAGGQLPPGTGPPG
jgi:hypothetical protein